jgi:XTP/dITP diphosphohydrolase
MKLIIASNNQHKIKEIKAILQSEFDEILSLREAEIDHETVEDGNSFLENARKKAREIAEISGECALSDDSGICVDFLDGAPGIYSARFAGEHGNDTLNNNKLLELLENAENRSAHYTAAVSLVYPDGKVIEAEGHLFGKIIRTPRGEGGFGYDPIFVPEGETRTVAEMSDEEKNRISHRGRALKNLLSLIKA